MSIVENPIGLGKIYGPSSYFTHWGEMIAEEGSHGLLIAMDGIYARMFRKQAKGYLDQIALPRFLCYPMSHVLCS